MDLVHAKHGFDAFIKENDLIDRLKNKLSSIPNITLQGKFSMELILYVCNIIENEILSNKKHKINKLEILKKVFQSLFPFTPDEIKMLEQCVQFLHDNKKIKKLSCLTYTTRSVSNWISKKIL